MRDHLISQHGVYVRECGNKLGMTSQFLRLVVRPEEDVAKLIDGMASYARSLQAEPAYREFNSDFNDDPLTGDLPITGTGIMNLGSLSSAVGTRPARTPTAYSTGTHGVPEPAGGHAAAGAPFAAARLQRAQRHNDNGMAATR